jgi:hypothetical protein
MAGRKLEVPGQTQGWMGNGPSGQCPRAKWETPGPARGSVGNGLRRNLPSFNLAQWKAGSVADVNMPTAPGWQTPLREFIKILVPTLSEATCRAIGDSDLQD